MNNKALKRIVEARFRIVTPMFLGGADRQADDIRPASVKGMLRFWWRALRWQNFRGNADNDEDALKHLNAKEAELFGSAVNQGEGGQGIFLLKVQHCELEKNRFDFRKFPGTAYLAGMGLKNRNFLAVDQQFSLQFLFHPHATEDDVISIQNAVRVFGLLGGLGSRTRRGFGSITRLINDNDCYRLPTEEELVSDCTWLKEHYEHKQDAIAPFSAFNGNTQYYRFRNDFINADEALEQIGQSLNRYRTNGVSEIKEKNGKVTVTKTAEPGHRLVNKENIPNNQLRFFGTDHYHVCAIAQASSVNHQNAYTPQRAIFGLPHAYYFSSID